MMSWARLFRGALAALAALALSGCVPSAQSQSDEEREPHFMAGKKRVSTLDYNGAIEAFEKALEVNPRSAAAHFELACLLDTREADPAAAIYHYQSYLRLRPGAGNAEVVKQRVMTCKQELARNVSLGPLTERQQREFEQLVADNKSLTEQVKRLNEDLEKWRAYAARLAGLTNSATAVDPARHTAIPNRAAALAGPPGTSSTNPLPATKTHTVRSGETATSIAKRYGIKVDALLAANPKANPRRLQIGQSLIIPVP